MEGKDRKDTLDVLDTKKQKLEKLIEYRTKGSILRARCRWNNEGEKNTKYFLNLEKRHYKQAQNEWTNDVFYGSQTEKKLNLINQESCEGLLTKTECLNALKNMECNKTPGSDGLPEEFYKVFWNDIADLYLKSINQAYRTGQLSVTQRRGIIKLIPKKRRRTVFN